LDYLILKWRVFALKYSEVLNYFNNFGYRTKSSRLGFLANALQVDLGSW